MMSCPKVRESLACHMYIRVNLSEMHAKSYIIRHIYFYFFLFLDRRINARQTSGASIPLSRKFWKKSSILFLYVWKKNHCYCSPRRKLWESFLHCLFILWFDVLFPGGYCKMSNCIFAKHSLNLNQSVKLREKGPISPDFFLILNRLD